MATEVRRCGVVIPSTTRFPFVGRPFKKKLTSLIQVRRRGVVKEKVLARVAEFWECRRCQKVYWEGPKYDTACDKVGSDSTTPRATR